MAKSSGGYRSSGNVRRLTRSSASQKAVKVVGQPGEPTLRTGQWQRIIRPMRPIRQVTTLIKKNLADGKSMPEFKNTLQRAGVGARQRAITVVHQRPIVPRSVRGGANVTKVVAPPSPTNRGGIRDPYSHKRQRVRRAKT